MSKKSDNITFEALKTGSEAALKKVYVENRSLFLNFARKKGLNRDDALDVYQDTYIVFQDNIQSGRLTKLSSSISTYLIGIGWRILMQKQRTNQKLIRSEFLETVTDIDDQLNRFDIVLDELTSHQEVLKEKFSKLSPKCHQILTWFYYNRYSFKKIAELGNYGTENSAKSQKSRCLKGLKESILKPAEHATQ